MHLYQGDIIFRNFSRISSSCCYAPPALPFCAGVFHSPRVAFVRCLRVGEGTGGTGKTTRRFSYRKHVQAEVNFGRRMSLLKLAVFSTFSLVSQKKFFKHNCARSLRATPPHNFGLRGKYRGYIVFLKNLGEAAKSPDFVS
ncbi:hypothetical protein ALC56_06285 [Trachymyrmex septentrionalis]|uniref:Uncharacterized protein n=1 Tax=Trachymyrmex septentrionalis TaxID=34720 RepID=A0A195FH70_9HYME|nr:hypothetical protein ALC56_06285 [Trachymyrmex septentrionalis]